MAEREFDAVVIGAGPAGEVIAGRLADADLDVALVEPELVGGECSFWACMPSKALLRPAELLAEVRRVPGLPVDGDAISTPSGSSRVATRSSTTTTTTRSFPGSRIAASSCSAAPGGSTASAGSAVDDDVLTARKAVVIATGSAASMPPIDGLAEVDAWSSREVTSAKEVPASLIVIGGGVVGVEMAQAWSSLGTSVDLIEPEERIADSARSRSPPRRSRPRSASTASSSHRRRRRAGEPRRRGGPVHRRASKRREARGRAPARRGRDASLASRTSASSRSGSRPTARSRSTTGCGSASGTGSTRSATSTVAPCSPTWASTRRGSPRPTSSAATPRRPGTSTAYPRA